MKIKRVFKKILYTVLPVILISLLFTAVAYAQGMPGPPVFPSSPSEAPIDGGLGLLAAAGGTYALKKLRDRKKAEEI